MKDRKLLIIAVLALFVLAGCLGPGSSEDSDNSASEEGVVISDIVVSRTDIKWGETTRINVLFENKNKEPVRDLKATLLNTGSLEVVERNRCNLGNMMEANNPSLGPRKQCVWTLRCGDECRSRVGNELSLNPYIKYTYRTRASGDGDAVEVEFQDPEDFDSSSKSTKTYTIDNGDIELAVDYETPQAANSRSIKMDYELRNIGGGELTRPVDLTYSGSFVKNSIISGQSLADCRRMNVPQDKTSQSLECDMDLQNPRPSTEYLLRIKGTYSYRKERDININILPSEGEGPLPDSRSIVRREGGFSRDRLPSQREECFSFCYGRQEDSIGLSACLDLCSGNR